MLHSAAPLCCATLRTSATSARSSTVRSTAQACSRRSSQAAAAPAPPPLLLPASSLRSGRPSAAARSALPLPTPAARPAAASAAASSPLYSRPASASRRARALRYSPSSLRTPPRKASRTASLLPPAWGARHWCARSCASTHSARNSSEPCSQVLAVASAALVGSTPCRRRHHSRSTSIPTVSMTKWYAVPRPTGSS